MSLLKMIDRLIKAGYPEGTAKKIATGELPMDEASRLGRAIEQRKAIDKPLIHRTDVPDILEFMPSKRGRMGAGVYTTPREEYGQGFGNLRYDLVAEQVPATFEQRLQIVQDISKQMMAEGVDPRTAINTAQNRANEILKSQGYTTVEMAQKHGGQKMLDEVLVLDPANLRDLRRAAFDPDNIGKPNILGSAAPVAAGGVLAALGMAPQEAEAGAFPYAFKMAEDALERGSSLFTEKALKSAASDASGNSRTAITMMSPDEFLRVVPTPENSISQKNIDKIAEHIRSGGKLDDVPFLIVKMDDDMKMPRYSGHEGRHRALALKQLGIEEMPVRIKMGDDMGIRWDQLHSGNPLTRKSLPEQVLHEGKGNTSSVFPIKKTPTGFETARSYAPVATAGILGALGAGGADQAEASRSMARRVSEGIQANPNEGMIGPNAILEALMGFLAPQAMGDATMDAYNRRRVR